MRWADPVDAFLVKVAVVAEPGFPEHSAHTCFNAHMPVRQ